MIYMGNTRVGFNALTRLPGKLPPEENPVKFRDCDGTVLYAYTPAKIASMQYLPPLPVHDGLTCQGWNWTLAQIKTQVAACGVCEVGATYTTDDGKTRIKLTIQDPKYTTIPIVFQQTVANGVKVNWGDGSAYQTYSSTSQQTISHTYAPSAYPATYTITFEVTSGTMSFPTYIMGISSQSTTSPRAAFLAMINEVNIGNNVASIGQNAFQDCHSLYLITLPNTVASLGIGVFDTCQSLTAITIPNSITSIPANMCSGCFSLSSISIPSQVTSIGNYAFFQCYALASIAIPSQVTSIGAYTFYNCQSLVQFKILGQLTSIGSQALYNCWSLTSITMPSSITSIEAQALYACYGLKTFDFRRSASVPTLANVNAFQNTPTVKEIVVPDELYDTWIAASNWNSSTNQIKTSIVKASESSLGLL